MSLLTEVLVNARVAPSLSWQADDLQGPLHLLSQDGIHRVDLMKRYKMLKLIGIKTNELV